MHFCLPCVQIETKSFVEGLLKTKTRSGRHSALLSPCEAVALRRPIFEDQRSAPPLLLHSDCSKAHEAMRPLLFLLTLAVVLNVVSGVQCYITNSNTTKTAECPGKTCFNLEYKLMLRIKTIMATCGANFKDDVKKQLKGKLFSVEPKVAKYVTELDNCNKPYVNEKDLSKIPVLGQCCEGHLCNNPSKAPKDRKAVPLPTTTTKATTTTPTTTTKARTKFSTTTLTTKTTTTTTVTAKKSTTPPKKDSKAQTVILPSTTTPTTTTKAATKASTTTMASKTKAATTLSKKDSKAQAASKKPATHLKAAEKKTPLTNATTTVPLGSKEATEPAYPASDPKKPQTEAVKIMLLPSTTVEAPLDVNKPPASGDGFEDNDEPPASEEDPGDNDAADADSAQKEVNEDEENRAVVASSMVLLLFHVVFEFI
ncbi:hypothetical protein L596_021873 [Steinernema carpocapsae]|uniref:Uncharacterized protein n=1 Tax=Steinernema carpocapsae TaxID=34508 RepID=A0A4U5MKW1_STECR|nr:hypothetical protein L596_021873 [Steinernema carpocapsae]